VLSALIFTRFEHDVKTQTLTGVRQVARLTAVQFREKHARRLSAAVEDIRQGVMAVTVSPTAKAAEKADKMRAGIIAAIDSGKWQRGLKRVSLEEWKDKMINKGVDRIPAGIEAAAAKVEAFASEFLPYVEKGQAEIAKMPDVTLQDSINRVTKWINYISKFKRTA